LIIRLLQTARHGPLKRFRWIWSISRPVYRFAIKFAPGATVSKKIGNYGPFKLDRRFAFSNFESWGGQHNRGFSACIEAARDLDCVLDVGAHIGLVTLPLSSVISKEGTVYAFEPALGNSKYLSSHLASNSVQNVKVVTELLGAENRSGVEFFESNEDSGMNTVSSEGKRRGYESRHVDQVTLDTFCDTRGIVPELVKIDTEGAEIFILEGGRQTLSTHKPTIFLSVHPRHIEDLGGSLESLETLISELGYKVSDIDGNPARPTKLTEYLLTPA